MRSHYLIPLKRGSHKAAAVPTMRSTSLVMARIIDIGRKLEGFAESTDLDMGKIIEWFHEDGKSELDI